MSNVDIFIKSLISGGVLPGMSVLVSRSGQVLFKNHYGFRTLLPGKEKLGEDTIYDLASLTKPLITSFLMVYLLEREKNITLKSEVKAFFPDLPFNINLEQLLTHTSGLPGWYPFYLYDGDYLDQFKGLSLNAKPGRSVEYSCVGYILLYYIIQKIAGMSFMDMAREVLFNPLDLKNTFFKVPKGKVDYTAPTEQGCAYERQLAQKEHRTAATEFEWPLGVIHAETHDCNSRYLGGTAGNAGLFSTTADVFRLAQQFFPSGATILKSSSLELFYRNFTPLKTGHRTIGFKRNSSPITSGGRAFSWKAIGHNGFTGTSMWLEPRNESVFILLSNRIHPAVDNETVNFNKIRRKLHRMLVRELGLK